MAIANWKNGPMSGMYSRTWANEKGDSGYLDPSKMVSGVMGYKGCVLMSDAANAFNNLWRDARRQGITFYPGSGYRSFQGQKDVAGAKAATPGKSIHGWGRACDLYIDRPIGTKLTFSSEQYKWLFQNAWRYKIINPPWAVQGGSNPEAWHWEYIGTGDPNQQNLAVNGQHGDGSGKPDDNYYVSNDEPTGEQISAEQQAARAKYNEETIAYNKTVESKRLTSSDDSYVAKATKTYVDKLQIKANQNSSRDTDNTLKDNYDGSEIKTSTEEGSTRSPNSAESVEAYLASELYAIKKRGEDGNDTGQTEFTRKTI